MRHTLLIISMFTSFVIAQANRSNTHLCKLELFINANGLAFIDNDLIVTGKTETYFST
jgi:hypothetical protein